MTSTAHSHRHASGPRPARRAVVALLSTVVAVSALTALAPEVSAAAPGRPLAWGPNGMGQTGTGTVSSKTAPANVDTTEMSAPVSRLSTSEAFGCAIAGGAAWCWGADTSGQLGDGGPAKSLSGKPQAVVTTGVLAGRTVTDISAGGKAGASAGHTCAVASGAAFCWGRGTSGQLGNLGVIDRDAPVAVATSGVLGGKTVTAVSAGETHSCAVASGRAVCWGSDSDGQLGNGAVDTGDKSYPVEVDASGVLAGKTVTAISAGWHHTCAIADGAAYCWGSDANGQLGNGPAAWSDASPAAVAGLAGRTVTAISAGYQHTCAVADGAAYCWGQSGNGQSGTGASGAGFSLYTATAVSTTGALAGRTAVDVATQRNHSCASTADGVVACWGLGTNLVLGSAFTDVATPTVTPYAIDTDGALSGHRVLSLSSYGVVAAAVPGAVQNLVASAADSTASLSWTAPAADGGSPVTSTTVERSFDSGATWSTIYDGAPVASQNVSGLPNGVAVQFRVRVVNAAGLGAVAVSSPVTPAAPLVVTPAPPVVAAPPAAAPLPVAATPVTRPGQVQSWKLTKPVPSKRLVTWKRPVVTANNAATAYRWRLSATNGRTWSTWFVVASKAVSTRLLVKVRPGTRYVLVLVPLNRAGSGKASAIKFRI